MIKYFKFSYFPLDILKMTMNRSFYKILNFTKTNKISPEMIKEQTNRLNSPNINLDKEVQKDMMDCFHRITKNYEKYHFPREIREKENEKRKYVYEKDEDNINNNIDLDLNSDLEKSKRI